MSKTAFAKIFDPRFCVFIGCNFSSMAATTDCREGAPVPLDRRIANAKKIIEKGISKMNSCGGKDLTDIEKQYQLTVLRISEPSPK